MQKQNTKTILCALFAVSILANAALWLSVRTEKVRWLNVPPAPAASQLLWSSLGDPQFAYRSFGSVVQNMGDTGGRVTNLREYDFEALSKWFMRLHSLDARSDFAPYLAGFFFGGVRNDPESLDPLIDYLEVSAGEGGGQKWRWLAQAAYLARFRKGDLDRALELANKLASFENPDMAPWARQMPAFVLNAKGDKEAAYELLINLLKTNADTLHPSEVNATVAYICEQILTPAQVLKEPLCKDFR